MQLLLVFLFRDAYAGITQAVLDGAKAHPGKVIPLYILSNFLAPLAVLPGGPFQVWMCGFGWG